MRQIEDHTERQLPNDPNAEVALLSAILCGDYNETMEKLSEIDFYRSTHKIIFRTMKELHLTGSHIDVITLTERLKASDKFDKVGGFEFINKLSGVVLSNANSKEYIKIILKKSASRKLIVSCSQAIDKAYEMDINPVDIRSSLEAAISGVGEDKDSNNRFYTMKESVLVVVEEINNTTSSETKHTSVIQTGFSGLDDIIYGFKPGQLIILAANTSFGKSMFMLNVAFNMASVGLNVAVFTLEMEVNELMVRLLSSVTDVPSDNIVRGNLNNDDIGKIMNAGEALIECPIYINCCFGQTLQSISQQTNKLISKVGKLDFLIIDYLQLMSGYKGKDREGFISGLSRELKTLAGDLKIPIMALSQINKEINRRVIKEPILGDLRESGAIDQNADTVIFINREWYYDKSKDPDISTVKVAKNRAGRLGEFYLSYQPEIARFSDIEIGCDGSDEFEKQGD